MTSVFPVPAEPKTVSMPTTADTVWAEDNEPEVLGGAKVEATFKMSMEDGKQFLDIRVPLEVHQDDVRWSLVKDQKGNQRKHGLIVACGQIPADMTTIVTRADGSRVQCKAKKKTLAINIGFDPTLRTILPAEA